MDTIETSLTDVEDTIDITIDDSMNTSPMHKLFGLDLDDSYSDPADTNGMKEQNLNMSNDNAANETEEEIEMTIGDMTIDTDTRMNTTASTSTSTTNMKVKMKMNKATPVKKHDFHANEKVNSSVVTAETENDTETETSMFQSFYGNINQSFTEGAQSFTEGAGLLLSNLNHSPTVKGNTNTSTSHINPSFESSMDQEPKSPPQSASKPMLSNELFLDAFDQLTDIAMAAGIVSESAKKEPNPNPKEHIYNDDEYRISTPRHKIRTKPNHSSLDMELDGPGRISSAANNYNSDDDDVQPFDEMENFDESHSSLTNKGEMSAMARMRYLKELKAVGKHPSDLPQVNQSSSKSYQEIQKEKHEKWRNVKAKANKQEAEHMQMFTEDDNTDNDDHNTDNDDYNTDTGKSLAESESKSADHSPIRERRTRGRGSEDKGNKAGFFDLSMLTRPLEQVQAAIVGAVMGRDSDDDDSCASSYYDDDDDDVDDDDESQFSRNERKSDKRSTGRGQSGKKKSKGSPPRRESRSQRKKDWDSDDSDEEVDLDLPPVVEKSVYGGFSKSFLEVRLVYLLCVCVVDRLCSMHSLHFMTRSGYLTTLPIYICNQKDITGDGIELDWHRPRLNAESSRLVFKAIVHIQISDTNDSDGHEEPNLIWEIMEDERASRRTMSQVVRREKLSLFDILSIERATESLEMKAFPHADPDLSILITLNDSSCYLFEAPDLDTTRKVMHGLKWMEARMVYNIIVGNMHNCSEMLTTNKHFDGDLTAELFQTVTNQLVEKTANS